MTGVPVTVVGFASQREPILLGYVGRVRTFVRHKLAKLGLLAAKKQAKKGLVPSSELEHLISVVCIASLLHNLKL